MAKKMGASATFLIKRGTTSEENALSIAKLFCKKSKVAEEEVTDGDDDEAAVALQPNGEEKKNAVNKEEDIEKEMVVDVKINTMNTN